MQPIFTIPLGVLIPLCGTTLGACAVFFCKKPLHALWRKTLAGFAAGIMLAASVWSLLIPAIQLASLSNTPAWIPAVTGFAAGIAFLLLLELTSPSLQSCCNGRTPGVHRNSLLVFAITLHNLPEGMAVGVILAGTLEEAHAISAAGALALAFGIAVQNIPEGAIISMPLRAAGKSRKRAFLSGFLSGTVEPIGAVLTLFLAHLLTPALPYILSFAAGAMVYVSVEELIPEAQEGSHTGKETLPGSISIAAGFLLMMLLDLTLG